MEKKNTILLTVIAIATLLVAVVGATFAYYTANVTTENESTNNKVTGTTKALASATFTYGNTTDIPADGLYPGYKWVKELKVTGTCPNESESCEPVDLVLSIKADGDVSSFGGHIKWYLYKDTTENGAGSYSCTNTLKSTEATDDTAGTATSYFYESKCTDESSSLDKSLSATETPIGGQAKTYEYSGTLTDNNEHVALLEDIKAKTNEKYYLVVEYENDTQKAQNNEQGHTFSVTLDVTPQIETAPTD